MLMDAEGGFGLIGYDAVAHMVEEIPDAARGIHVLDDCGQD